MAVNFPVLTSLLRRRPVVISEVAAPVTKPWRWLLPALVLGLLLAFVPSIDLAVSALFYSPDAGFYLKNHALVQLFYRSEVWLCVTAAVSLLTVLLLGFFPRARGCRRQRRAAIYLLLVLAIGPGLIVNVAFKNHWDRARPHQIERFGGARHFTPALLPSDQCERNCSFTSGHAALGFSFVAIGFVAGRRRQRWMAAGVTLGAILGFVRIAQGAHFLSDVVFAFCFVFITAWILHALLYRTACTPSNEPRLAAIGSSEPA